MAKLILSDRFAQILSEIGVKSVFTLTGGHIVPLLDSCRKEKIEIIDVRHEQNAVFAETFGWERAKWFDKKGNGEKYSFKRNNSFEIVADECKAVRNNAGLIDLTSFQMFPF